MDRISIIAGVCGGEPFIVNTEIRVSQVTALIEAGVKPGLIHTQIFTQLTAEDVIACQLFASLPHQAPSVTVIRKNLPAGVPLEEYDPASRWGTAPVVSDEEYDPASRWGAAPAVADEEYDPASRWGGIPPVADEEYDPASKWGGTPAATDEEYDAASRWGAPPKKKSGEPASVGEWTSEMPTPRPIKKRSRKNDISSGHTLKLPIFGKSLSTPKALLITFFLGSLTVCVSSLISMSRKPPKPTLRLSPAIEANIAMQQGDEAYAKRKFDLAENAYRHAKQIDPRGSRADNNIGLVYQIQNRLREAEDAFKRALVLSPKDSTYHYNLGLLYARGKRFKDAEEQFIAAIKIKPDAEMHNNLGGILFEEEEYDSAIAQYRTAIQLDPKCSLAIYNLKEAQQLLRRLAKNQQH